jgi:hypothetical protein
MYVDYKNIDTHKLFAFSRALPFRFGLPEEDGVRWTNTVDIVPAFSTFPCRRSKR